MLAATLPLADFLDPGMIAVTIPIFALMIPIISLLQKHQQRMAEIIHGHSHVDAVHAELEQMKAEVQQLRSIVSTQSLALEGLAKRRTSDSEADSLAQRLG